MEGPDAVSTISCGGVSGFNGISLDWLWWASASRAVMSSLMAGIVSLKMFFTENVLLALKLSIAKNFLLFLTRCKLTAESPEVLPGYVVTAERNAGPPSAMKHKKRLTHLGWVFECKIRLD